MPETIERSQNICRHCLVCGTDNKLGLQTRFYETATQEVIAVFTLKQEHQSYPQIGHGGISGAILDETIGRAIMAYYDQNTFGVTLELNLRFRQPVPLEVQLQAIGRIDEDRGRIFSGSGELLLPDGQVAVSAQGRYLKRRLEQITDSSGFQEQWFAPPEPTPTAMELPNVDNESPSS